MITIIVHPAAPSTGAAAPWAKSNLLPTSTTTTTTETAESEPFSSQSSSRTTPTTTMTTMKRT